MNKALLIILTVFALSSCSKDDQSKAPKTELEKLPPATQTGANTAGCLVNGVALLPYGYIPGDNPLVYQDGLNFVLSIGERKNDVIKSVGVFSRNQPLEVGTVYQLGQNNNDGNSKYGIYSIDAVPPPSPDYYTTTLLLTGELKITYHNYNQAILSGTFWFDAINANGEKVEVREGRFDMHY
jgi:hypothetical protein